MDALDLVKVCTRRWYVMLPILVLALAAGMGLAKREKPVYEAYANYALIYPQSKPLSPNAPDPRNANPLAANDATLLGEAMMNELMTPKQQEALGGVGNSGVAPGTPATGVAGITASTGATGSAFTVSLPSYTQNYNVATWGPSEAGARDVIARVLGSLPSEAKQLQDQAGAPQNSRYIPFVTTTTQVTEMPPKSPMKMMIAVVAVGGMAGGALCVALERFLAGRGPRPEKRRTRRDRRRAPLVDEVEPEVSVEAPAQPATVRDAGRTRKVATITGVVPGSEAEAETSPRVATQRSRHALLQRRSG